MLSLNFWTAEDVGHDLSETKNRLFCRLFFLVGCP